MKFLALSKGRQSGIKGSVVNVPILEESVCNSLPRTPTVVPTDAGLIPLILKKMILYKGHYSFQYIQHNSVVPCLKSNNHLYQSATVNEDWVGDSMADDKDMFGDITENETANMTQKIQAVVVAKILSIYLGEGKIPIHVLMNEHFEEYAFHHLLCTGKYGWNYKRPIKLSAKKYFQQRILVENQTFGIEYLFAAQAITETSPPQQDESIQLDLQLGDSINCESISLDVNIQEAPEEFEIPTSHETSQQESTHVPTASSSKSCPVTSEIFNQLVSEDEYRCHIRSLNDEQRTIFQMVLNWCKDAITAKLKSEQPPPLYLLISRGTGLRNGKIPSY
ncbi:unnamed protein product [Mytilus coruscus]|uniref:Uncharacterized protein n=1 Tax=Mytilus coruscus TaxID=42192 RepID=A0A6J8ABS9_MYTCO|nr:unnamed protein product [Mytilus coruscus]